MKRRSSVPSDFMRAVSTFRKDWFFEKDKFMRIATASAVVITIIAGHSLAEDQRVNINNDGFDPDVVRAAPGDTVTWRWLPFGGGASLSSGEPCTADGLFQFNLTGGPFGNPTGPQGGFWGSAVSAPAHRFGRPGVDFPTCSCLFCFAFLRF